MNTIQYIDLLAETTDTGSDYAVAKLLDIKPSAISNYRAQVRDLQKQLKTLSAERDRVEFLTRAAND